MLILESGEANTEVIVFLYTNTYWVIFRKQTRPGNANLSKTTATGGGDSLFTKVALSLSLPSLMEFVPLAVFFFSSLFPKAYKL